MSPPKVSIIITTYKESTKPYLDLCVKSALNLNYANKEIIIVGHKGLPPEYWEYFGVKTIAPPDEQFYNPRGLNYGIENASQESEYYFILNDDVILTKDCLSNLVQAVNSQEVIAQPISPCDNYRAYSLVMGFRYWKFGKEHTHGDYFQMTKQFYRLDEFTKEMTHAMMHAESIYPVGAISTPMLCMFATLIPKKVWQKVGIFDENFKTGQDDIDYSKRAQLKNIPMMYCLNSLVWHFGGVTADDSISLNNRKENIQYFKNKWGEMPPGMPENILDTLDESYKFSERNK